MLAGESTPVAARSTWWRWPLIPFAAIGAGIAAALLVTGMQWLGVMMNWGSTDGWFWRYFVPVTSSVAFGYAFGWTTCKVAPSGRRYAGTAMVTLLGIVCLLTILRSWFGPALTISEAIRDTVQCVATVVAAIAAVIEND